MILKFPIALSILVVMILPVYAQEPSEEQIVLTDKGTLEVGLSTIPAHPQPGEETKMKINFINKTTKSIQPHIDYSIIVSKGNQEVFGIPLNHVAEQGSITIPYKFQEAGDYTISVGVEGIVFAPIPKEIASFTISVAEKSQPKNGCLIATAAFGSELAPQVQFLREYRDNSVMSTAIGSSFINAFNSVYYTFSPTVADAERNNPALQEVVKTGINPLLGILQITKISNLGNSEASVIASGMMASFLIGVTYLWPVGLASKSIREGARSRLKIASIVIFITLSLTLISSLIGNVQFMMISTSALVLSLVGIGAMFSSCVIWKLVLKMKITFL